MDVDKCRPCNMEVETSLAFVECLCRNNTSAAIIKWPPHLHWCLYRNYRFVVSKKWYHYKPEKGIKIDYFKILWNFNSQTDCILEAIKLDIIVIEKETRKCLFIDVDVPGDCQDQRIWSTLTSIDRGCQRLGHYCLNYHWGIEVSTAKLKYLY